MHTRGKQKTLNMDAAIYLVEFTHGDFALLFQEIEKALVYVGDETTVTLKMIQEISALDPKQSGWQLSEAVVWGGPVHYGDTDLYGLVGQLRYQLQLGLQLSSGKEPPRAAPKKLEKIRKIGLEASYYLEGLKELFNLELNMRSNALNQELLFDLFRAKLKRRRSRALPTT
jgi:DNA polymerase III delta subunit